MRFKCTDCEVWAGDVAEMLVARNPFDPMDEIRGCPHCKSVEQFVNMCDEAGCSREASCGWPTAEGGYRRTCHEHNRQ